MGNDMRWGIVTALVAGAGCASGARMATGHLVKYQPGQPVLMPAKAGISDGVLGLGFTRDFNDRNSRGGELRLYEPAADESSTFDYDKYDSSFEMLDDRLKIRGHVSFLFFDAGVTYEEGKWYARYSIYRVMRVKRLTRKAPPKGRTDLVATAIYYGWSLNYVIYGDVESFGGDLGIHVGAFGAGLKAEIQKRRLKTALSVVGLKPRRSDEVVLAFTPDDVRRDFEEPESTKAVPIFVEYTPVRAFDVEQPEFYRVPFKEGAYTISHFHLAIAPRNDGKRWDVQSELPEPEVRLMVDGELVGTCGWLNETLEPDCEKYFYGKRIKIKEDSVITFSVRDMDDPTKDVWEDVGSGEAREFFTRGRPNVPIDFDTQPNIVKAQVVLSPAR